jgi:hypothetical protein
MTPISKARCHPRFRGIFAIGGKDVNLEVLRRPLANLSTGTSFWKAKNVRNDEYNLTQPVWISDLQFLDGKSRPLEVGFSIVICTRFHQVSHNRSV